ncbi:MAG: hypothetical protein K8T89_09350 [Planctomycetes bacterium]|nr:hypothetical protein [Planctomycetota bacterium]
MSSQTVHDLGNFHRFVGEKIHQGETSLSPEQVLDEWRDLNPDAKSAEDELDAIQEAIDDIENGDVGIPIEEFDRDFRVRRNLPTKS